MENGVTNLLFGKNIKFDHWGTMTIKSHTTGVEMHIKVHKSEGLLQSAANRGKIEGILNDELDNPKYRLKGYWTGDIDYDTYNPLTKKFEQTKAIFKQITPTEEEDTEWDMNYRMNDFALNLNYIDEDLAAVLPPTDSRFRPDMRAFENGKTEQAELEKRRLENAQ